MGATPFESPEKGDPGKRRRRSRRNRRTATGTELWSWRLLCIATLGCALALGGLHTATVVVVALLTFASALLALHTGAARAIPAPTKLLFALSLFTLFQALPLPSAVVRAVSPGAYEIWRGAFETWGQSGWMSLSVDRGATFVEALKWAMYGAAFLAAHGYGATRGMARGILLPLVAASAVAVVTLAHGLSGSHEVYGLYKPSFGPSMWHIGPLLNPNHLSSYLNVGVFSGLGLLVARRQLVPRWVIGVAVAFLIPNAIVAGSRGGILGLLVGTAIFFAALPRRRYADLDYGPIRKPALFASLAAVFVVASVLTLLLASEMTRRELYNTNVDKLRMLSWSARLVADFPWTGVGRGAFEGVFSSYRTSVNQEIHTHPENIVAQWLAEWGIPVGVAAFVAFAWLLRPKRLGRKWSAVGAGAVAALGAALVHNLVDFGLEVPAVALLVIVTLGVCYGHEAARVTDDRSERVVAPSRLLTIAAAGLGLCLAAAGWGGQSVSLDRLDVIESFRALKGATPEQIAAAEQSTARLSLRHPAEPYFYRMGALLALRAERDPMRLLGHALERGPTIGRSHLIVARVLASRHAVKQALLELRLAAGYDTALTTRIAKVAAKLGTSYEDLMRVVPEGRDGCAMLVALARLSAPERRVQLLEEAVARSRDARDALALLVNDHLRALEGGQGAELCAGELMPECLKKSERWLALLDKQAGRGGESVMLRARLLQVKGNTDGAARLLAERCPDMLGKERTQCLKARLNLAAKARDEAQLAGAARDYIAENCLDADSCASALAQIGDVYASKQDWIAALSFYDRAAHERSEDPLWMKVGRAALRTGAYQRAVTALGRVHSKAHFEPEYSRLIQLARNGQVGAALKAGDPP